MNLHDTIRPIVEQLDADVLGTLHGRSMFQTSDWSGNEIDAVCNLAAIFELCDLEGVRTPLFPQQLDYALFFDSSTRTRSSWAGASTRLGSQSIIVDDSSTQVSHGETAEETGAMLGMNAHALGIRHDLILGEGNRFMRDAGKGIDDYLRATGNERVVPIVNLQCDIDHPTQTLADLCWLRERHPEGLEGKTIAVSWAYSPSYAKPLSVPQGLIMLLTRCGMHVRLAHPSGYELMQETTALAARHAASASGSFTAGNDMDAAFADADVVYPKSWGPYDLMLERVAANRAGDKQGMRAIETRALERNKQHTDWICDERRMQLTRAGKALYMHCLPADSGAEVSAGVMDGARVDVAREANKKLYVIMGLLAAAKQTKLKERLLRLMA